MKLDKAIEILEDIALEGNIHIEPDDVDAIKLGIEALKYVIFEQDTGRLDPAYLLPGETKE